MFEVVGIDHIVLRTTKLAAMLKFYVDVLGCKIERQTARKIGLTQLRAGTALIDLVVVDSQLGNPGGGPPSMTENNLDHFCLQLQQISESAIRTHLVSHGIEVGEFERR